MLALREMREVVAQVNVATVGHAAHEIVALIHAAAEAVDVGLGGGDELAEKGVALQPLGWLDAGEAAHGRGEIDEADRAIGGAAGDVIGGAEVFEFFGNVHKERHVETGVRGPAFAARHAGAVVGPVENNGIVGEAIGGELREDSAGVGIGGGDAVVVKRPIAADLGCVGMIGGDADLGGVVSRLSVGTEFDDLALVTLRGVEDGEERFAGGAIFPVGGVGRGVPDGGSFREVVVLLHVVAGVVTGLAEELRKHFLTGGIGDHAAHVVATGRRAVEAGDDRGARGRADGRNGPGVGVAQGTRSEFIEVRRGRIGIAVGTHLRAVVLAGNPEDVGLRGDGGEGEKQSEGEGEKGSEEAHGRGGSRRSKSGVPGREKVAHGTHGIDGREFCVRDW